MLYEPKRIAGRIQHLCGGYSYGKIQRKSVLLTVSMGLLEGHYFYIKKDGCTMQEMVM